jgi:hypothetical protein
MRENMKELMTFSTHMESLARMHEDFARANFYTVLLSAAFSIIIS